MSFGGGPSAVGPSQAELTAQAERKAQLVEERKQADLEADRLRQGRIQEGKARRGKQRGRRSLISGSELGTKETLG